MFFVEKNILLFNVKKILLWIENKSQQILHQ